MKRNILYISGAIFAILIVANPSSASFEKYAQAHAKSACTVNATREVNLFIAATFYYTTTCKSKFSFSGGIGGKNGYYFGILGNYFYLSGDRI